MLDSNQHHRDAKLRLGIEVRVGRKRVARLLRITGSGGISHLGTDVKDARAPAYEAVGLIDWPGMQYRRDIGLPALAD
jgi:phosphoribosylamine-glycine ligase